MILIPQLGRDGAAWATCLAYLSLPLFAYLISGRYLVVRYEWDRLAAVVGGLIATAIAITWPSPEVDATTRIAYSLPLIVLFCVFLWFTALKQTEREGILELFKGTANRSM